MTLTRSSIWTIRVAEPWFAVASGDEYGDYVNGLLTVAENFDECSRNMRFFPYLMEEIREHTHKIREEALSPQRASKGYSLSQVQAALEQETEVTEELNGKAD